jgi:hypothetical protein
VLKMDQIRDLTMKMERSSSKWMITDERHCPWTRDEDMMEKED